MSKFNTTTTRPATGHGPISTERTASGHTHEAAPGFAPDTKSALFLLAVTNFVSENTFYETAHDRDNRYTNLVRSVAVEDIDWLTRFVRWLRNDANMRTAALVAAAEGVKARLDAGLHGHSRHLVDASMSRADEPGEFLAYWTSRYGRAIPKPIKRGVGDAVLRLYSERSLLKYDTATKGFRFGDVIDLVHPTAGGRQGDLFAHALDRRHGREKDIPESLETLISRAWMMSVPPEERRNILNPAALTNAGMTWEALAGWLQGPMDRAAWEAVIPSMGYMALLRNLRNFDEAGVSDEVAAQIAAKLTDPTEVSKSRQLPMRFLSAYRAAPSLRWAHPLDKALTLSLNNIPPLPGRTLILVDTSGSMHATFSKDGTLMRWDAAVIFGLALAARCHKADVVSFSGNGYSGAVTKIFQTQAGESLLRAIDRWKNGGYFLGGGTATEAAVRQHYLGQDRVIILTDEQAHYHGHHDVTAAVPHNRPAYTWNLAGYQHGHAPSGHGNRHTFGGLSDAAFKMIPLLEAGQNADWPF